MPGFNKLRAKFFGAKTGAKEVENEAGGRGFTATNALDSLIMKVGKPGFSEPAYYGKAAAEQCISVADLKLHVAGLTADAVGILEDIVLAASAPEPGDEAADVLRLAAYLRNENNVRLTPQIMLAVCGKIRAVQRDCRRYAPRIITRADEIKEVFAAARALFNPVTVAGDKYHARALHAGSVSKTLKKVLGDAFGRFTERDFLKWEGRGEVGFKDVLLMCYQAFPAKSARPVDPAIWNWLVKDEVSDDLRQVKAWKLFNAAKGWNAETKRWAREAGATWEAVASKFGGDPKEAQKAWEWLATARGENGRRLMGYQATLMNLRNFAEKGVTEAARREVAEFITAGAGNGRQMPTQYLSARNAVSDPLFSRAIAKAVDAAADNVPELPGTTVVAADTSGSMRATKVSAKSERTALEAATLLAAIIHRRTADWSMAGAVGDRWEQAKVAQGSSVLDIAGHLAGLNVGWGTNLNELFVALRRDRIYPDRIVLLTDGQSWLGEHMGRGSCNQAVRDYRRAGWKGHLHEVHMVPYDTTAGCPDERCHIFSSYTENLVDMIRAVEGLDAKAGKNAADTFNVRAFKARMREMYP